jgi:hypothetical protein
VIFDERKGIVKEGGQRNEKENANEVEGFMNDKKREEGKWFTFLGEDWNQPFE